MRAWRTTVLTRIDNPPFVSGELPRLLEEAAGLVGVRVLVVELGVEA